MTLGHHYCMEELHSLLMTRLSNQNPLYTKIKNSTNKITYLKLNYYKYNHLLITNL